MSKKFKVIGEGSYGCVIKPSLKCKNKLNKKTYKNKVSKIMRHNHALIELNENNNIKNLPNIDKYAIVNPILCKPKLTTSFKKTAKKCENEKIKGELKNNISNLSLLLLEDGGMSFHDIIKNYNELSSTDIKIILYSIINLFEGLIFFRQHKIIHNDIKGNNYVYNNHTFKSKFIDFGLARNNKKLIRDAKNNKYDRVFESWPYYAPEHICSNYEDFRDLIKCKKYNNMDYKKFINKFILTLDSYSLSYSLIKFFKEISKINQITKFNTLFSKIINLLKPYCHEDFNERNSNIELLIKKYKSLLKKYHIYSPDITIKQMKNMTQKQQS